MANGDNQNSSDSSGFNNEAEKVKGLDSAIKMADISLKKFKDTFAESFSPGRIIETTAQLEQLTTTMVRQTLGQTQLISKGLQETIANASYETSLFGIGIGENLQFMSELNTLMQRNTYLTEEQVVNMQLLARSAGLTSSEFSTLVVAFQDIGVGTQDAIENVNEMRKQASSYGLNVGQFMKSIGNNVKQLNAYNFKNGVEGFSKMVAKAQALRVDVSKTFSLAEKFLDPGQAIEFAASMQMIGGEMGALTDPFQLLYMAQNDVAGLHDEVYKAAESMVTLNEKTGEFSIEGGDMYRLRDMASQLGMDMNEVADAAVRGAQRTKKLDIIGGAMGSINEEDKELLANITQFEGNELKLTLPDGDQVTVDMENANDIDKALNKLREQDTENSKTEVDLTREIRDINIKQLSAFEAAAGLKSQVTLGGLVLGVNTEAVTDLNEVMKAGALTLSESLTKVLSSDNLSEVGISLTDAVAKGLKDPDANSKLQEALNDVLSDAVSSTSGFEDKLKTKLDDENIYKGIEIFETLSMAANAFGIDIGTLDIDSVTNNLELLRQQIGLTAGSLSGQPFLPQSGTNFLPQSGTNYLPQSVTTQEVDANENVRRLGELQENQNIQNQQNNNATGEVNVNGEIRLTLNGTDLPPDITNKLLKSTEFTTQMAKLIGNSTVNTPNYS